MKKILSLLLGTMLLLVVSKKSEASATISISSGGTYSGTILGTYSSLELAINQLHNLSSLTGTLTISIDANEAAAPIGGYEIRFPVDLLAAGGTGNVVIDGAGFTVTASPSLVRGSLTDAIFKIIGADFVTIQNFVMQENPANTDPADSDPTNSITGNNMTEWGVALLVVSAGIHSDNGDSHDNIQNNHISLNRTYGNTFGVYSNVRHSATDPRSAAYGGPGSLILTNVTNSPNQYNNVYDNNISEVNVGICFIGSSASDMMEYDNYIVRDTIHWGATGLMTVLFEGFGSTKYYVGILMKCQLEGGIDYAILTSYALNGTGATVRAIHVASASSIAYGLTFSLHFNTIEITDNLPGTFNTEGISFTDNMGAGGFMIITQNHFNLIDIQRTSATREARAINITSPEMGSFSISSNTFSTINNASAGVSNAIYVKGGVIHYSQTYIVNNMISDINAVGESRGIMLDGITIQDQMWIYGNFIHDIKSSSDPATGIYFKGTSGSYADCWLVNNMIGDIQGTNNNNTNNPSTVGMRFSMLATTNPIKVYWNTVYINASNSAIAAFSSAAVLAAASTTATTGQITLRNNLLINVSPDGGTNSKAVALWRYAASGNVTTDNYNVASNNNIFWSTPLSGTITNSKHYLYYEYTPSGTTHSFKRTEMDNFLAYIATISSTMESASHEAPVQFLSTAAATLDLHIFPNQCFISEGGSSQGIHYSWDFDGFGWRWVDWPYITDIGADQVTVYNLWYPTSGTDWHTAANWTAGYVPGDAGHSGVGYSAYISATEFSPPVIHSAETFNISDLAFDGATSSVTCLVNNGTLNIAGRIVRYDGNSHVTNYAGTSVTGNIGMNSSCGNNQDLGGDLFINNKVNNFTASNTRSVTIASASGKNLDIVGELNFGGTTNTKLNTGDNVTLISTATTTANVAVIDPTNFIDGQVTVERYINTGTTGTQHVPSWQFLSTPTTGQTIWQSWMEGQGTNAPTPVGYGVNIPGPGGSANGWDQTSSANLIKYWDPLSGYVGISNPTTTPLNNQRGWLLFVRGDRTARFFGDPVVPTVLRQKGTLYQPNSLAVQPPSTSVPSTLLGSSVTVGNPYASAINFNTMLSTGGLSNLSNIIAIFDPSMSGQGGYQYLDLNNSCELVAPGSNTPYYSLGSQYPILQSGNGFQVQPDPGGTLNGTVSFTEAVKTNVHNMVNRPAPATSRQYFKAILLSDEDHVLDGNATSFDEAFTNGPDLDDAFKIYNPGENFMIKRNGKFYAIESRKPVKQTDSVFYTFDNIIPQTYRLKFIPIKLDEEGLSAVLIDNYLHTSQKISLTEESSITFTVDAGVASYENRFIVVFERGTNNIPVAENGNLLKVYPNPVDDNKINISLMNGTTGTYYLQLVNGSGQVVLTKKLTIEKTTGIKQVELGKSIAPGSYQLSLTDANGKKLQQQVIIK